MATSVSHPESFADLADCEIWLNGEPHRIRAGSTVRDLLDALELGVERVAVEVDRRIVRRADWADRKLTSGASVEVVHFVGGG
jgi:thiamine biosynthesis protein ThiS